MKQYVATFHTHLAALRSNRQLAQSSIEAKLEPVPRVLSASCGSCVRYLADSPMLRLLDPDVEAVYQLEEEQYSCVFEQD